MTMEYRFTFSIYGLGSRDVAEANAEALLDAFERTAPEVGGAVGANLEAGLLEATFCVAGDELNAAAKRAAEIFVDVAITSTLPPSPLAGLDIQPMLPQPHQPRFPLGGRKRGAEAVWSVPELTHS
jgi:hypothetical protein